MNVTFGNKRRLELGTLLQQHDADVRADEIEVDFNVGRIDAWVSEAGALFVTRNRGPQ